MELKKQESSSHISKEDQLLKEINDLKRELKAKASNHEILELKKWVTDVVERVSEKPIAIAIPDEVKDTISNLRKEHELIFGELEKAKKNVHDVNHVPRHVTDKLDELTSRINKYTSVNIDPVELGCKNFFTEFLRVKHEGFSRAEAAEQEIKDIWDHLRKNGVEPTPKNQDSDYSVQMINTLTNNVDILKNQIVELSRAFEQHKSEAVIPTQTTSSDSTLDNKVIEGVKKNAIVLTQAIADIKVQLKAIGDDIDVLKTQKTAPQTDNSYVSQLVGELDRRLSQQLSILSESNKGFKAPNSDSGRINGLEERIGALDRRFTTAFTIYDEKFSALEELKAQIMRLSGSTPM